MENSQEVVHIQMNGNPQIEDGYLKIANELSEAFCRYRLSGREWQILWVILRKTYGFNKKEDWIPLSQFQSLTNLDKSNIIHALNNLLKKNIIVKIDNDRGRSYTFNKLYSEWQALSKSTTLSKMTPPVVKNDNKSCQKRQSKLSKMTPSKDNTKDNTKNTLSKDIHIYARTLFEFWNSKQIITHKDFEKFKPNLVKILKVYSLDEIKSAIENYALVLNDSKFFWTHKWSLRDFLTRGLDRFRAENFKEKDYLIRIYKSKAELDEERSLEILSKIYKEEEEKENDKKGNDSNIGNSQGSV